MPQRGHEEIEITRFNGLFQQGDVEEVPLDHFTDCENIQFIGAQGFGTRFGITPHQSVAVPLTSVRRIYNYVTATGNTLLVLTFDGIDGKIYHVVDGATDATLILQIEGMTDFAFCPYGGRAYISPFYTITSGTRQYETGMSGTYLYVYMGDGQPARQAGGAAPVGTLVVANGAAGHTDAGTHVFGVVFETDSGYLTAPAAFKDFVTSSTSSVSFTSIPTGDSTVVARHIVATKKITTYDGNTTGYQYFFIPGATLNDNITTVLSNQSFYDADLIEDASYLLDNFANIPAGTSLFMYHNRMVLTTPYDNISVAYVSSVGEPEAFNQVDGVIEVPKDGNPLTTGAELRDVMYLMKQGRTFSYVDNDDEPATWPLSVVDQAYGAPVHGIATVIDSGSGNVDFLLVATPRGLTIFSGRYALPELTWKIDNFWLSQDKTEFRRIQVVNDVINQIIYLTLPDRRLLIGSYSEGLDPQNIRWAPWRFDVTVNTVALVNVNELIIGAEENAS